jgi:hypothetical protein
MDDLRTNIKVNEPIKLLPQKVFDESLEVPKPQ